MRNALRAIGVGCAVALATGIVGANVLGRGTGSPIQGGSSRPVLIVLHMLGPVLPFGLGVLAAAATHLRLRERAWPTDVIPVGRSRESGGAGGPVRRTLSHSRAASYNAASLEDLPAI